MISGFQSNAFSYPQFVWWMGVVVDRDDPEHVGRHKVMIYGYHDDEGGSSKQTEVSKDALVWAATMQPTTSASFSGKGHSPTGILEGTTVIGFFADGHNAEMPIIMGTLPGKPKKDSKSPGKQSYKSGEADTNRLARGVTKDTSIKKQNDSVSSGNGWKEPKSAYAAEYPYNHVWETESGHVQEFDDTSGAERIRIYHKDGTLWEMHPGGDYVLRVHGSNYHIVKEDGNLKIGGDLNVQVGGDANIKVTGDINCQSGGDTTIKAAGDISMTCGGDFGVKAGGSASIQTGSGITLESGGNITADAGGICSINGSIVMIN